MNTSEATHADTCMPTKKVNVPAKFISTAKQQYHEHCAKCASNVGAAASVTLDVLPTFIHH